MPISERFDRTTRPPSPGPTNSKGPVFRELAPPYGRQGASGFTSTLRQAHIQPILEAFAAVTHLLRHSTDPLFIEDGNSAHGHESTRNCCAKFRTQHGIVLMPHPSISPDMNPIDKCRQRIKRALHRRKYQPTNEVEMQVAVTEEWEAMPCYFREDIYFVECFLFGMLEQRNSNMLVEQSFIWILWDNFE
jgi:hypothetical protein